LLTDKYKNIAMLDKKWPYNTHRRRKIMKLPLGKKKKEDDNKVKHPQLRSRRLFVKSIFMGIVGRPRPDKIVSVRFF